MWYTINNKRALDEIVFRDRNKAYGAYILRTEYEKTLFRALFFVMLGVGFFFASAWLLTREKIESAVDPGQVIDPTIGILVNLGDQTDQSKKVDPPKKRVDPPPPSNNNNNAAPIYTVGSEDTAQTDSVAQATSGPEVATGTGSAAVSISTGSSGGLALVDTTRGDRIYENYDAEMPEFEGGLNALRRFIRDHFRYPDNEAFMNSGGRIMVRFVVDENGNISAATIKHSAGLEFDNEALRVVKMLPRFKTPGKMNGHPVKVYYDLPIRFK